MKYCDAVVGNSSSGIIEAPAFKVPTVNIGDRQKGRVRAESIFDCGTDHESIVEAIQHVLEPKFCDSLTDMNHPCEKDKTAARIVEVLAEIHLNCLLKKSFNDLGEGCRV